MFIGCRNPRYVLAATSLVWLLTARLHADDSSEVKHVAQRADVHPLSDMVRFAKERYDHIREHVRDYSCKLVKRERIDGQLQSYQFAQVKVRCEQIEEGQVRQPLAVYMQYLGPGNLKDRRVLFIEGENGGKMLVRKGGRALRYLKLSIDPNSEAARRESNYPISEIGFDRIINRLIQFAEDDMQIDPHATNTDVAYFRDAKVGQRVCTRICVEHPLRDEDLRFYQAQVFIDDELQVPIRLVVYDWPEQQGADPPLIEEYTYVDLEMNVGLTDADFSRQQLEVQ